MYPHFSMSCLDNTSDSRHARSRTRAFKDLARFADSFMSSSVPTEEWESELGGGRRLMAATHCMTAWDSEHCWKETGRGEEVYISIGELAGLVVDLFFLLEGVVGGDAGVH